MFFFTSPTTSSFPTSTVDIIILKLYSSFTGHWFNYYAIVISSDVFKILQGCYSIGRVAVIKIFNRSRDKWALKSRRFCIRDSKPTTILRTSKILFKGCVVSVILNFVQLCVHFIFLDCHEKPHIFNHCVNPPTVTHS